MNPFRARAIGWFGRFLVSPPGRTKAAGVHRMKRRELLSFHTTPNYIGRYLIMPEKVMPGPVQDTACIREAVCIHTKKIYDSCKD